MAGVLSDDICRVTGVRPKVARQTGNGPEVVIATAGHIADLGLSPLPEVQPLQGQWEQYTIQTRKDRLIIVGSDPRGAAYGVLHVSRAIGVNPWYWWADIPVPSFETGTAQRRLDDYSHCSQLCQTVASRLPADMQPAFFEMLGYSVLSAEQMNRKFLMAQLCHETGSQEAARQSQAANDSLQALLLTYNTLLGGKWNQMMSEIPPGFCAKYQQMPQLSDEPTMRFRLPVGRQHPAFSGQAVELTPVKECVAQCSPRRWRRQQSPFRLVEGIGVDWFSLQLGQPHDPVQDAGSLKSDHADLLFQLPANVADSIRLCIMCVPFWPVSTDRDSE
jgi:hypothetical protein